MLFVLSSCSQKKGYDFSNPNEEVQKYIFTQIQNGTTPQMFQKLMKRHVFQNTSIVYVCEKMYPACSGILDCTGFYSDALDDASWVDQILYAYEESRIGTEIIEILENEENMSSPIVEETENTTKTDSENEQNADSETSDEENSEQNNQESSENEEESDVPIVEGVEKRLTDSYNRLKVLEFASEIFLPIEKEDQTVFIHASDKQAVRIFYDDNFRLVKKEYWNTESVVTSKLLITEQYEYKENEKNPFRKIIQSENQKSVSLFNENGLTDSVTKYEIKDGEVSKNPSNLTKWKYDEKNRIIQELSTDYIYQGDKLKNKTEKKQLFIYNKDDENISPDYEYYENNELKTKTVYTAKGNYSVLINFDSSNSVCTYYENYIKVKDVYKTDGVETRVRTYEQ